MKARLLFVNLLLLCCLVSCFAQDTISRDYNLFMQIRGRELTALCVMELKADSSIVGTVVNEFGMKAFDFSFVNGKAKVFNVIAFLDKWYIRKILRRDLRQLFHAMQEGRGEYRDEKYKMLFRFTPLTEDEQNEKDDDATR